MSKKSNPFWRFSLRLYASAGVEQACLALQEAGADVNILLFCCWHGSEDRSLNKQALRKAMRTVASWQQRVVQPLRLARRGVKLGLRGVPSEYGAVLRRQIARAELDAEYLEQLALSQIAATTATTSGKAAAVNLTRYLELLEIPRPSPIERHTQTLLGCCR